jgi:hypothetical protein
MQNKGYLLSKLKRFSTKFIIYKLINSFKFYNLCKLSNLFEKTDENVRKRIKKYEKVKKKLTKTCKNGRKQIII